MSHREMWRSLCVAERFVIVVSLLWTLIFAVWPVLPV